MNNSNTTSNALSSSGCNVFNPEYCTYKLPCGTCMMLKSICPHITNNSNLDSTKHILDRYPLQTANWDHSIADIPDSCKNCPNHPSNGGSGNCNCTLGNYKVTC